MTKVRNPLSKVYFGKAKNGYYVRYQQPTTRKLVVLAEPSLEMLAETVSALNVVEEKEALQNEEGSQRLSKQECYWLKNYVRTPKEKRVRVCLKQAEDHQEDHQEDINKKSCYEVSFFSQEKNGRKYLTFDQLPAVVDYLYQQRTVSYRIRRKNLPWRAYAFILSSLEERENKRK